MFKNKLKNLAQTAQKLTNQRAIHQTHKAEETLEGKQEQRLEARTSLVCSKSRKVASKLG